MQLVFDTKGLHIDRQRGLFAIQAPDGTVRTISPRKVSSIAVTQSCWLSAGAVELAAAHEIPIYFHNYMGKVTARMGAPHFQSISTLRRNQVLFNEKPDALRWMLGLYWLKTEGQVRNLNRLKPDLPAVGQMQQLMRKAEAMLKIPPEQASTRLMAAEAGVARQYWQALAGLLPRDAGFEKRTRMPALDPFNACLNYLYGMLYTVVESGLFAAGLDPHLGILHADAYNKPVLAYDFIEPFRPWADWLLIEQFMERNIPASFFSHIKDGGMYLGKQGKACLIPLFNNWLRSECEWGGRHTSVRNHIYQLAGKFAKKLRSMDTATS